MEFLETDVLSALWYATGMILLTPDSLVAVVGRFAGEGFEGRVQGRVMGGRRQIKVGCRAALEVVHDNYVLGGSEASVNVACERKAGRGTLDEGIRGSRFGGGGGEECLARGGHSGLSRMAKDGSGEAEVAVGSAGGQGRG